MMRKRYISVKLICKILIEIEQKPWNKPNRIDLFRVPKCKYPFVSFTNILHLTDIFRINIKELFDEN